MTQHAAATVPTWTLGDRLRKAREFARFEQGELAARIGVSRGTVSNYELGRGTRPPKLYVLRAWAAECGVPQDWLIYGDNPDPHSGSAPAAPTEQGIRPDTREYRPRLLVGAGRS